VRIELAKLPPAPLITARALAPLSDLLHLAYPLAHPKKNIFLFPKGINVEDELTGAQAAWNMRVERFDSRLAGGGVILRLTEVSPRE
jgi:16S rRNA (guanine527-N7)-methyltransferase